MARKVKISKWKSERFAAYLHAPEQVHGARSAKTQQEALDNLAKSPGVLPQHRAFVARAALEGKGIEEK
jgi:hypothetical protein